MKKLSVLMIITFVLFAFFAAQSFAAKEGMDKSSMKSTQTNQGALRTAERVSEITEATVWNEQGEQLGTVDDLVVGPEGRIQYLILSHGGFLDIGDRLFAIPWKAVKAGTRENSFVVSIDKQRLAQAPSFERNNWPDFSNPDTYIAYYGYYKIEPDKDMGRSSSGTDEQSTHKSMEKGSTGMMKK